MRHYKVGVSLFIALAFFLPVFTGPASAQPSIAQATKEVTRDVRGKAEEKLMAAPKKPPRIKEEIEAEAEPEGPVFSVKKIELIGVKTFAPEDFKPLLSKYENRDASVGQLKILCREIERDYLRKGVIAACFLPPQEVKEGLVTIRVIEAKMGKLEIKDHRYFFKDRVAYYWRIKEGEVLRYDKISRSLQFMNKNPDRTVKAALRAGKKPETTDVLLEVATNFPVHFTGTFDREGSVSTGKERKGIGIVHNNLLGLDDTLILGYTGGKFFGGAYGYHRVPITNYGTTVMYGYSQSRAFPKKDYEQFEMSSRSEDYSIFIYQDLYRKDEYKGELSFGFDANNKRVVATQGTLNADRLRIMQTGLTLVDRALSSTTTIKPEFYQGLNFLGARKKSDYSSRQAENTFSKAILTASFKQALAKNFQASLKFKGQWASEKLMPQQEMYLGGIDSVRGYPSGDYLADNAFQTNLELLVPAFFIPDWVKVPYGERPIKDEITGVLFFDYGYGEKRGEIQGEVNKRKLASVGAGVRVRLLNQAILRVEWGFPLEGLGQLPVTEFSRSRVHFSVDFQDDIPEEVERFKMVYREEYIKEASWQILNDEMRRPDSPLAGRVYEYISRARKAKEAGDLQEAKKYYSKAANAGNTAYKQTEVYVRDTYNQVEELRKESLKAVEYYKNGELEKAKEAWQKIGENAKMKPLVIDLI